MSDTLLLYFEEDDASASRIATAANMDKALVQRHRFPDGEMRLRLPPTLPARVCLLRTLDHPDPKLIELLLAARSARDLGARHMTLIAPYLAYMRQDTAFHPGEVVSQRVIGDFLANLFDALITVDPHLHRTATLKQAVPVAQSATLSGAPLLADLIAKHHPQPLLIGPDEESAQWLGKAAAGHGFDWAVCKKVRLDDHQVHIVLPEISVIGRSVVLLDDVASSGHTVAVASRLLMSAGAASVDLAVTHALFAGNALELIHQAGVRQVWSTDCIAHPSNAISMAPAIAQALLDLNH